LPPGSLRGEPATVASLLGRSLGSGCELRAEPAAAALIPAELLRWKPAPIDDNLRAFLKSQCSFLETLSHRHPGARATIAPHLLWLKDQLAAGARPK
jgi:hypothetical protein